MTSADLSELRRTLIEIEGLRLSAYQDSEGFWSIGVGRLIDARKGGGLSREEVGLLLENDISKALHDCQRSFPWFADLDPVRQRALVEMRFQLGLGGLLEFRQTLEFMAGKNFKAAAGAMLQSKVAKQTPKRWQRLAQMMKTGIDPA